ncbi:MAG: hypothetical protein E7609_01180 [Ruminococcaceae bacterium]|nr:hypothetical protein [Oscillospiraceae bacterium]
MNIQELLERLELSSEVKEGVLSYLEGTYQGEYDDILAEMTEIPNIITSWEKLKEALGEDEHQRRALALELKTALLTYENYRKMGIPDDVFIHTMKVFKRYTRMYKEKHGVWGFDRAYLVPRHLSMRLFRLGTLEYEYKEIIGEDAIVIHIPPDASLDSDTLDESFRAVKEFTRTFYPDYQQRRIIAHTWLTSPMLEELLPEGSKILIFKRKFDIIAHKQGEGYISSFVFDRLGFNPDTDDIDSLPENTSLQRNIKALYKRGGRVGYGVGVLKDFQ